MIFFHELSTNPIPRPKFYNPYFCDPLPPPEITLDSTWVGCDPTRVVLKRFGTRLERLNVTWKIKVSNFNDHHHLIITPHPLNNDDPLRNIYLCYCFFFIVTFAHWKLNMINPTNIFIILLSWGLQY